MDGPGSRLCRSGRCLRSHPNLDTPVTINSITYDSAARKGNVKLNSSDYNLIDNNYWNVVAGKAILSKNGVQLYQFPTSVKKLGGQEYQYEFNLNEADTGVYQLAVVAIDDYGNESTRNYGNVLIDHNPPTIQTNIVEGQMIESLDEIKFTIKDAEDPNVFVSMVNLSGGAGNENVNLGSSNNNGLISLEYPVLFPTLEQGETYTVTLIAEDSQGNQTEKKIQFQYGPRQVDIIDGMDGKVYVPAVMHEFLRSDQTRIIKSYPLTLNDGSLVQGSYDVLASLRSDSDAPLVVNGTTVYPGSTTTIIKQHDFSASEGKVQLPIMAAVQDQLGVAKLMITTSAPNSPVILVDVHLWKGDVVLQSKQWDYRQVVDPLDIIAMPGPNVPCRVVVPPFLAVSGGRIG